MNRFFLWLEKDKARARKVVLMGTIFVFLLITIGIFSCAAVGLTMSPQITALYTTLVALIIGVYGFYTGTSSDKTAKLADKAADIMMDKLDKTNQN